MNNKIIITEMELDILKTRCKYIACNFVTVFRAYIERSKRYIFDLLLIMCRHKGTTKDRYLLDCYYNFNKEGYELDTIIKKIFYNEWRLKRGLGLFIENYLVYYFNLIPERVLTSSGEDAKDFYIKENDYYRAVDLKIHFLTLGEDKNDGKYNIDIVLSFMELYELLNIIMRKDKKSLQLWFERLYNRIIANKEDKFYISFENEKSLETGNF